MLPEKDICDLKKGEVVAYKGEYGINLLHVNYVDMDRGRVSGHITEAAGVNSIPIEELSKQGIDIAKWQKGSRFRELEGLINFGALVED